MSPLAARIREVSRLLTTVLDAHYGDRQAEYALATWIALGALTEVHRMALTPALEPAQAKIVERMIRERAEVNYAKAAAVAAACLTEEAIAKAKADPGAE